MSSHRQTMKERIEYLAADNLYLRTQLSVMRTDLDNAIAARDKFRKDFEEQAHWVGVYKAKLQLAQARSTEPSERRAAMAAAKAAAIAAGHPVKVGAP